MPRPIKAGLIGTGSVALIGILPQLTQPDARERLELVAVRDDVELVLIATPIPYHYPIAMRALEAGKHAYVQKTMATTAAEAREMVETARPRGPTPLAG